MQAPKGPLGVVAKAMHRAVGARRALRGPRRPGWSHEFETLATFLHTYASFSMYLPLRVQRNLPSAILSGADAAHIERVDADGVPGAWFSRPDSDPDRVLYYLHGGGYVIGSIHSHQDLLSRLCVASGARVFAIDYRLAPEHPYPAQLEDALTAYHWLLASGGGTDPAHIVIGGESAGGGLTLATLQSLRARGEAMPAATVLISPWLDLEARTASYAANERYDYLNRRNIRAFAARFIGTGDRRDPLAAPIYADLTGLPPLLIHAGGAEVFLDEAMALARRARDAGVDVELDIWPDMIHAFPVFGDIVEEAAQSVNRIAAFFRRHTASVTAGRGAIARASPS